MKRRWFGAKSEKKFQKCHFLWFSNFNELKMLRIRPEKVVLRGKWDPRNRKNRGPGRGFLPRSRRPKFQNFLAPRPLRSGRSAKAPLRKKMIPPAPEGGQGKPLPLYPPSDASASPKIVDPRRPPRPVCSLRRLKTPCKSIPE